MKPHVRIVEGDFYLNHILSSRKYRILIMKNCRTCCNKLSIGPHKSYFSHQTNFNKLTFTWMSRIKYIV